MKFIILLIISFSSVYFFNNMNETVKKNTQVRNNYTYEYFQNDKDGNIFLIHNNHFVKIRTIDSSVAVDSIEEIWQISNDNGISWINHEKFTRLYDEYGHQIFLLMQIGGIDWVDFNKSIMNYNGYYIQERNYFEKDFSTNNWNHLGNYLYTHSFNDTLHLEEEIYSYYNNGWILYTKILNTYDINENLLEFLRMFWENGNWVNADKFIKYYENGKLVERLYLDWKNGNWVNDVRHILTYVNNLLSEYKRYTYTGPGNWQLFGEEYYTYDLNGNEIQKLIIRWGVNNELHISEYDSTNQKTVLTIKDWDGSNWVNAEKVYYTYDNQNRVINLLRKIWTTNNTWKSIEKIQYVYHNINTPIDEDVNINKEFILSNNYPNPFNPETKIEYQLSKPSKVNISIFNSLGQLIETLVNSNQISGNHSVSWNAKDVSSGVYYYRIVAESADEKFTNVKKCIVLK